MAADVTALSDIDEREIQVFVEAVSRYFSQITGQKAEIRAAFLTNNERALPVFEFTGMIKISGDYYAIYFSTDRFLLSRLLQIMNEPRHGEEHLLDAVGEIANTLAGNARQHFGEMMEVSVPLTMDGKESKNLKGLRDRPYVIMVRWKQYEASVIIDIKRKK